MRQVVDSNKFFEVLGYELRTVIADDSRPDTGMFFDGFCDYQFDIELLHCLPNLPMNDVTAEPVED